MTELMPVFKKIAKVDAKRAENEVFKNGMVFAMQAFLLDILSIRRIPAPYANKDKNGNKEIASALA